MKCSANAILTVGVRKITSFMKLTNYFFNFGTSFSSSAYQINIINKTWSVLWKLVSEVGRVTRRECNLPDRLICG